MTSTLKVLFYSHDTFGLGHLRRCRTIAGHLAEVFPGLKAKIITGASVASDFEWAEGVEYTTIVGVVKTGDGKYASRDPRKSIQATVRERAFQILRTAIEFRPDIFIVDKEPLGLMGEVVDSLRFLRSIGTRLVLGLRDVLDDPRRLLTEWTENGTIPLMESLYDDVWIYGPEGFHDPLQGIPRSSSFRRRVKFMGFLHRKTPGTMSGPGRRRHLLVTAGGGGDGIALLRAVIAAYRRGPKTTLPAVLIMGPYMPTADQNELAQSAKDVEAIELRGLETDIEVVLADSAAVVAMGGYNTFCEIMSFNKPALIVPRSAPRREQAIRAERAAELGLVDVIAAASVSDGDLFEAALARLMRRRSPMESGGGIALDGLENIAVRVAQIGAMRSFASAPTRPWVIPLVYSNRATVGA